MSCMYVKLGHAGRYAILSDTAEVLTCVEMLLCMLGWSKRPAPSDRILTHMGPVELYTLVTLFSLYGIGNAIRSPDHPYSLTGNR